MYNVRLSGNIRNKTDVRQDKAILSLVVAELNPEGQVTTQKKKNLQTETLNTQKDLKDNVVWLLFASLQKLASNKGISPRNG